MLTYDYEPTDAQVHKRRRSVYIIMVWDGGVLRDRIQKICDSFSGERFDVPRNGRDIAAKIDDVKAAIGDARMVLKRSRTTLRE